MHKKLTFYYGGAPPRSILVGAALLPGKVPWFTYWVAAVVVAAKKKKYILGFAKKGALEWDSHLLSSFSNFYM
jgi:hypothetical protein